MINGMFKLTIGYAISTSYPTYWQTTKIRLITLFKFLGSILSFLVRFYPEHIHLLIFIIFVQDLVILLANINMAKLTRLQNQDIYDRLYYDPIFIKL